MSKVNCFRKLEADIYHIFQFNFNDDCILNIAFIGNFAK